MFLPIWVSRPESLIWVLFALAGFALPAQAAPFKISTWNLDWLTLLPASSPLLPPSAPLRSAADWSALAEIAASLDSDVVAVQEVTDEDALRRLYPSPGYHLVISHAPIAQNVGLVLRAPWSVIAYSELTSLDRAPFHGGHALRPGLDVTVSNGTTTFRLLVVHLKSGCWERPWREMGHACPILREQIDLVGNWMTERDDEGENYIVLGDFNRRFTSADPYYRAMSQGLTLGLVTSGLSSPCEGGTYFIDHILLGGAVTRWLVPDSLRVKTYARIGPSRIISDHCPVSVRLDPHNPVSAAPDAKRQQVTPQR